MIQKDILITGATSGIGKATAIRLAELGHNIHILARNASKANQLIEELRQINKKGSFSKFEADLSSLKSVDTVAHLINCKLTKLDVLINNAGGIFQTRQISADGYEITLATNHLGPFHLTNELIPLLAKSGNSRIINVSSGIHPRAKVDIGDFNMSEKWSPLLSYANTKLYNIYSAKYWAEQHVNKGITAYSLHPGIVDTGFASEFNGIMKMILNLIRPLMTPPTKGAKTSVFIATTDYLERYNGAYFEKCQVSLPSVTARDDKLKDQVINESFHLIQKVISKRVIAQ